MRATAFYTSALLLGGTASAWNILEPAVKLIERGAEYIEKRQASASTSYNLSITSLMQGQVQPTSTPTKTATGNPTSTGSAKSGATQTGTQTGSQTGTRTSDSSDTSTFTQTVFDPRGGPGGLSMLTPAATLGPTYYKIKDQVTFGWNYTSCSILPTAIDILAVASNSAVFHTFTIALNESVTGPTQAYTWDTNAYQTAASDKLLTAQYTLVVHDAAKDVSATPSAGYLGTWSGFIFAMYVPKPSVDFQGYQCVTCSGAMSNVEKQAMGVVFGVTALTILSFTWFAGAAGMF